MDDQAANNQDTNSKNQQTEALLDKQNVVNSSVSSTSGSGLPVVKPALLEEADEQSLVPPLITHNAEPKTQLSQVALEENQDLNLDDKKISKEEEDIITIESPKTLNPKKGNDASDKSKFIVIVFGVGLFLLLILVCAFLLFKSRNISNQLDKVVLETTMPVVEKNTSTYSIPNTSISFEIPTALVLGDVVSGTEPFSIFSQELYFSAFNKMYGGVINVDVSDAGVSEALSDKSINTMPTKSYAKLSFFYSMSYLVVEGDKSYLLKLTYVDLKETENEEVPEDQIKVFEDLIKQLDEKYGKQLDEGSVMESTKALE